MKKWIPVVICGVLVIGLAITGYLYFQKTKDLKTANADIDSKNTTISGLNTVLDSAKAENVDLKTKLTASEAEVTTLNGTVADLTTKNTKLGSDLTAVNSQLSSAQSSLSSSESALSTAQTANTALTTDLKTIKDPRHFSSVQELTDWLQKDDTNTKYATLAAGSLSGNIQVAFILQERATRDGYLLPAYVIEGTTSTYIFNSAIIGDTVYWVDPTDDTVDGVFQVPAQPSHPEPLP